MKKSIIFLLLAIASIGVYAKHNNANDTVLLGSPIVDHGFIVNRNSGPVRNAYTPSPGIDIYSAKSDVYAITGGLVVSVFSVADAEVAIVQQGERYFIYNNMDSLMLKKGDTVRQGDKVGDLKKDGSLYTLNFQVWHSKDSKKGAIQETGEKLLELLQITHKK